MKNLLTLTATGTALAGLAVLVVLLVLVLIVIPGGLGILRIAFDRATRWLRQAREFLWRTKPAPEQYGSRRPDTRRRLPSLLLRQKPQPDRSQNPTVKPI
jgi:hypothetical protein